MKPKIDCHNEMTKFKTNTGRQQEPTAVRPQLPRDKTAGGRPFFTPGEMPKGGFQAIWSFNDKGEFNTKDSPTSGGGKKVY